MLLASYPLHNFAGSLCHVLVMLSFQELILKDVILNTYMVKTYCFLHNNVHLLSNLIFY